MSGVAIIQYLLANSAGLTAVVPAAQIMAGPLPVDTPLPAIAVQQISGQQHNNLSMSSASYLVTERVQITVIAQQPQSGGSGYQQTKAVLALVRAALPLSRGTVNGFECQSVIPDIEGPDLYDPDTLLCSQSIDYFVTYRR